MPIQRRLPKMGLSLVLDKTIDEVNLSELAKLKADVITLDVLKAAGLVTKANS